MKTIELPCIVIDTNVLISAGLLPNSRTAETLAVATENFVIAQNDQTWHELETRIARKKFDRYFGLDGRSRHLIEIASSVRYFPSVSREVVSRDPDDDKFIGLAMDAGAQFIISGDSDLLVIGQHKGIEIVSAAQFLDRMKRV
jgi:putative PIN family toxin of toxin-antitoxin system